VSFRAKIITVLVPAREIKSLEPAVTALLYGLTTWRHSVPW